MIAIDSRLSPASLLEADGCLQQTFADDSQLKYMDRMLTKKINNYVLLIFILLIHLRINIYMALNIPW